MGDGLSHSIYKTVTQSPKWKFFNDDINVNTTPSPLSLSKTEHTGLVWLVLYQPIRTFHLFFGFIKYWIKVYKMWRGKGSQNWKFWRSSLIGGGLPCPYCWWADHFLKIKVCEMKDFVRNLIVGSTFKKCKKVKNLYLALIGTESLFGAR